MTQYTQFIKAFLCVFVTHLTCILASPTLGQNRFDDITLLPRMSERGSYGKYSPSKYHQKHYPQEPHDMRERKDSIDQFEMSSRDRDRRIRKERKSAARSKDQGENDSDESFRKQEALKRRARMKMLEEEKQKKKEEEEERQWRIAQRVKYKYLYDGRELDLDYNPDMTMESGEYNSSNEILKDYRRACDCSQDAKACQQCLTKCQEHLKACGQRVSDCGEGCSSCLGQCLEDACSDRKCCSTCPGRKGGHFHGNPAGECLYDCLCQTCLIALQAALCPDAPGTSNNHRHHDRRY